MADSVAGPHPELAEATITELQQLLTSGALTSVQLVERYQDRIEALDRSGPRLRSVLETNPDAHAIAEGLDRERRLTGPRGPLHGVPILIKDNIGTADKMETTAGSLALLGARPETDAPVARKLREAGAILLGKTNLSEWANFRSLYSSSGWSARGGQTLNPYALDVTPSGSSSGSGSAAAAGLAAGTLGTETDGSIISPSAATSIVGLKPTVGLTSRTGVVPIAHSQDSVGPMTRTVTDAAIILTAIAGVDPVDPATAIAANPATNYAEQLDRDGLRGARLGVPRNVYWGYSPKADTIAEAALHVLRDLGAEIIDPAPIPTAEAMKGGWPPSDNLPLTVLLYEFKADLNAYLAALDPTRRIRDLADLIDFNERHAEQELPYFGQELLYLAQEKGSLSQPEYLDALERNQQLSRQDGIDAVLREHRLDALVMPTGGPPSKIDLVNGESHAGGASRPAALAGYPVITVPAGYVLGLPVGLSFIGTALSEARLLTFAYAFEQATLVRRSPGYVPPSIYPPESPSPLSSQG